MPVYASNPERLALYRKIEVARKQLTISQGMTEDQFRTLLEDRYKVTSRKNMSQGQLANLVQHFENLGVTYTPRKGKPAPNVSVSTATKTVFAGLNGPQLKKIEALLAEKAYVERSELPWAYAAAILKKLNGGVALAWEQAGPAELSGVIAALVADAKRKGRHCEVFGEVIEENQEIIASYGGRCRNA